MRAQSLETLNSYEFLLYVFLFLSAGFLVLSANIYLNTTVDDPALRQIFFLSIISLVLGLFGAWSYHQAGEPIRYSRLNSKYLPLAILILLAVWFINSYLYNVGIYQADISSSIDPSKLLKYLEFLAPLFVIVIAFIENLIFVVVLPTVILEKLFGTTVSKASISQILIASIISGIAAALFHIAWKPLGALINTFLYFSAWAFVTLLLRNSALADAMHLVGNALGILYMTIYPQYILWSVM